MSFYPTQVFGNFSFEFAKEYFDHNRNHLFVPIAAK